MYESLQAFSDKYLIGKPQVESKGILSDGNCFFHAVLYAMGHERLISEPLYKLQKIITFKNYLCKLVLQRLRKKKY